MKIFKTKSAFSALDRIIRSVIRLAIKTGIDYEKFNELTKYHFVAESKKLLEEEGEEKKSSNSTVLTKYSGIQRRYITKMLEDGHPIKEIFIFPKFIEADVVQHWKQNYTNLDKPRPLNEREINSCVKEVTTNVSSYDIIKSLLDENVIKKVDQVYYLNREEFLPESENTGIGFKLEVASRQILGIVHTTINNLNHIGDKNSEFHSTIHYKRIDDLQTSKIFKDMAQKKLYHTEKELIEMSRLKIEKENTTLSNDKQQGFIVTYIELPDDE